MRTWGRAAAKLFSIGQILVAIEGLTFDVAGLICRKFLNPAAATSHCCHRLKTRRPEPKRTQNGQGKKNY
jgi:hypothetical protein